MKNFLIILLPVGLIAGALTISGEVSMYDPPGAQGPVPKFGVRADYRITQYLSADLGVSYTKYSNTQEIHIPGNINVHPLGSAQFDPYVGAGIGYYLIDNEGTLGAQTKVGFKYPFKNASIGFEVQYIIPDVSDMKSAAFSYGGQLSGSFSMEI